LANKCFLTDVISEHASE